MSKKRSAGLCLDKGTKNQCFSIKCRRDPRNHVLLTYNNEPLGNFLPIRYLAGFIFGISCILRKLYHFSNEFKNMKYLLLIVLLVAVVITAGCVTENKNTTVIPTQTTMVPKVTVYFFYGEECPHCHTVMPFIQNLSKKYPEVDFRILETWHNETNMALFESMNKKLGISAAGVPEVVVDDVVLIGSRDIPDKLEGVILGQKNNKQ